MKWLLTAAALLLTSPTVSADQPVTMWQLNGDSNRVYLLGSIHLLRDSDYPLPAPVYEAYDDAEVLIMELDMDDMDPGIMQALVVELGMNGEGETLQSQLGDRTYARAESLAEALEIPLAMMSTSRPWLAAMTIEIMMMNRMGFDPQQGIEMHLVTKAGADRKEILGLESEREQILVLSSLSARAQSDLLMQILADGGELESQLDDLIDAWRTGDIRYMQKTMLEDMRDQRELYKSLVLDRNRNWLAQIEKLLDDEDDYLVVVGALHLVGGDGVPELLRKRGHDIQQMRQPGN